MTRTCTVPGCQSRHHSHGFCNAHRHHWRKYGDPTAGRQRAEAVMPCDVEKMLALAADGLGRMDIAACTGWSVQTVGRHVGHAVPARHINRQPDIARYRRMIKAAAVAEYGTQGDLAGRFGLTARSFKVTLVTARRRVSEADRMSGRAE